MRPECTFDLKRRSGKALAFALAALAVLGAPACSPRAVPGPKPEPPPPGPKEVRFTPYPAEEVLAAKNIHAHRGEALCQVCHFQGPAPALKAAHGCPSCHEVAHSKGHDVGTKISRPIAKDLPLPGGHVVCHTCHDPHDTKKHLHGLRKKLSPLCLDCHPNH